MRPISWLPVVLVLFMFAQVASATTYLEHLAARNNRPQARQTGVVNANICAAVSIYVPLNVTITTCVNVTVDLGLSILSIPLGTKISLLCTPSTTLTQVDIADK
jgi:predicted PurR-regulated permease PerM